MAEQSACVRGRTSIAGSVSALSFSICSMISTTCCTSRRLPRITSTSRPSSISICTGPISPPPASSAGGAPGSAPLGGGPLGGPLRSGPPGAGAVAPGACATPSSAVLVGWSSCAARCDPRSAVGLPPTPGSRAALLVRIAATVRLTSAARVVFSGSRRMLWSAARSTLSRARINCATDAAAGAGPANVARFAGRSSVSPTSLPSLSRKR